VKQFSKKQSIETALTEINIFKLIQQHHHEAHQYISKLSSHETTSKDLFLIYELGGTALSKQMFDVKGEFYEGARVYFVHHQQFYFMLKKDKPLFKKFISTMLWILDFLSSLDIIHADIKPDNILVTYENKELKSLQLIDFGSSFEFSKAKYIGMSTPEYLCPEILSYLANKEREDAQSLQILL